MVQISGFTALLPEFLRNKKPQLYFLAKKVFPEKTK